jgi:hypothetical protein
VISDLKRTKTMNINRHNYEELFLLYVDGELSPAERMEVENFAAQNADLAAELKMLQDAVLPANNIVFQGKESLCRSENIITATNYQEYFLMAVDNELKPTEKEAVEKFVLQHPGLQDAYTTLQATKLPVEVVPHPHKKELYRTERERRIIPMSWLRMSAAAAIIIIAGSLWFTLRDNNIGNNSSTHIALQPTNGNVPSAILPPVADVKVGEAVKENKSTTIDKNNRTLVAKNQDQHATTAGMANTKIPAMKRLEGSEEMGPKEQQKQRLLPPTPEMVAALIKPNKKENAPLVNANGNVIPVTDLASTAAKPVVENEASITTHAVYKDMNAEEDEDNIILIGSAEFNKKKLKSILGKASGLFKRKAKNDDDDNTISIANFQIKSK